jgi:hypothetical protein
MPARNAPRQTFDAGPAGAREIMGTTE